jgi:sporulation protein YlmC with PRC-barrel domain
MNILSRNCAAVCAVTLIGAGVLLSVPAQHAYSQAVEWVTVDIKVVGRGFRATKLIGTTVQNDKKEKIGELDDIVIGREKDRVLFAILQVGGFLGLGAHLVAVPYNSLQIDDTGRSIVLPGASKDALKKLPVYKHPA